MCRKQIIYFQDQVDSALICLVVQPHNHSDGLSLYLVFLVLGSPKLDSISGCVTLSVCCYQNKTYIYFNISLLTLKWNIIFVKEFCIWVFFVTKEIEVEKIQNSTCCWVARQKGYEAVKKEVNYKGQKWLLRLTVITESRSCRDWKERSGDQEFDLILKKVHYKVAHKSVQFSLEYFQKMRLHTLFQCSVTLTVNNFFLIL